jgi:phosphohistidine phosphatase
MSRVYLLRHAQAQPGLRDHARQLTEYGKLQGQMMGQWLKLNLHELDLAIVSSARRTQQTFETLELGIESVSDDQAYNAGATELIEIIQQYGPGHEDVMVIAHNPGVSDLAALAGYPAPLAPCSCVVLELEQPLAQFDPKLATVALWHQARP